MDKEYREIWLAARRSKELQWKAFQDTIAISDCTHKTNSVLVKTPHGMIRKLIVSEV